MHEYGGSRRAKYEGVGRVRGKKSEKAAAIEETTVPMLNNISPSIYERYCLVMVTKTPEKRKTHL
jgi:hypothetical protein